MLRKTKEIEDKALRPVNVADLRAALATAEAEEALNAKHAALADAREKHDKLVTLLPGLRARQLQAVEAQGEWERTRWTAVRAMGHYAAEKAAEQRRRAVAEGRDVGTSVNGVEQPVLPQAGIFVDAFNHQFASDKEKALYARWSKARDKELHYLSQFNQASRDAGRAKAGIRQWETIINGLEGDLNLPPTHFDK